MTDPAKPQSALWRLVLGLCIAVVIMFALSQAMFSVAQMILTPPKYQAFIADIQMATTPTGLLVLLFSMGFMGVGAILAAKLVHHRRAHTLFGHRAVWQGLRVALGLIVLNAAVILLPPWDHMSDLQPALPPGLWLVLLPLSLAAILIQTGAEELFFRGYLQSQLAARFAHPVIWLTVPSALFALGHHAPGLFGDNALYVTLWAFAFGIAMADLTARTGSLGPAIAVHFINNTGAILLVSLQGDMSGLALYHLPFDAQDTAQIRAILPVDLAMIFLSWLTARLVLRV